MRPLGGAGVEALTVRLTIDLGSTALEHGALSVADRKRLIALAGFVVAGLHAGDWKTLSARPGVNGRNDRSHPAGPSLSVGDPD